jgi:hypothetical protein
LASLDLEHQVVKPARRPGENQEQALARMAETVRDLARRSDRALASQGAAPPAPRTLAPADD